MTRAISLMVLAFGLALSAAAHAEKIVGGLSDRQISINSGFAGERLTLYGNVEPDTGATEARVAGPFDVIVVVTGPVSDRVVWRKDNRFGIWINAEEVRFDNFPSFKWVLASGKLSDIADPAYLDEQHIVLNSFSDLVQATGFGNVVSMRSQLVRLMEQKQLFGVDEKGIVFQSNTLYSGQLGLPSDVPNGSFLAETYLFKDKVLVAHKAEGFSVRKAGFERFVGEAAHNYPLLYGLTCVILAVTTGWLGRLVFRR